MFKGNLTFPVLLFNLVVLLLSKSQAKANKSSKSVVAIQWVLKLLLVCLSEGEIINLSIVQPTVQ